MENKKSLQTRIEKAINMSKVVLHSTKGTTTIEKNTTSFWPLFLFTDSEPDVPFHDDLIDTCATAMGLISTQILFSQNINPDTKKIINEGANSLLFMRNTDGSWPSFIIVDSKEDIQLEGIINDTSFAINALIRLDFLSENPIIDKPILDRYELGPLKNRLNYINQSINWLSENRANKAWSYTGIERFNNKASVISTTSATVSVLNTLQLVYDKIKDHDSVQNENLRLIKLLIEEASEELLVSQSAKGGFSRQRGEFESIAHTCSALSFFLSSDYDLHKDNLIKAVKWLLNNKNVYTPDKINNSDYFDEYAQFVNSDKKVFKKNLIHHETFIDAIIFYTALLINDDKLKKELNIFYKLKLSKLLSVGFENLLKRQSYSGKYLGAFKCRRQIPSEDYPIYGIQNGVKALNYAKDNFDSYVNMTFFRRKFWTVLAVLAVILLSGSFLFFNIFKDKSITESVSFAFGLSIIGSIIATVIYESIKKYWP
ncbi:hypothetical protein DF185_10720 [Marinifilum breve]|uniref:Squalene cyclase C-terminal domain-containing protein n=1 Tax=Marinifilum breve TaxID=2184082 RepID=A0A2V3ZWR8_9BACT|nr:prenyltransferase/squalene oxidase repeat-containing protein [Marinifilum breve]PXY01115.1 hypothetical protein DF185_10720 [Marinifilum breve]